MSAKHDITIVIQTSQGSWNATFPKTDKVQQVIAAVVTHFGFASNGRYELRLRTDPNQALTPERTLVSYDIKDGDILIFSELGTAV